MPKAINPLNNPWTQNQAVLGQLPASISGHFSLSVTLYSRNGSGTFVSDRMENKNDISCWGVILPNVIKEVYPGLLSGIESFASNHNRNIIICNSDNDEEKEYNNVLRLVNSDVKGFIIVPYISNNTDYRAYNLLVKNSIPFVMCNRQIDGIKMPYVGNNGFYGGYLATKRLAATGAKKIAYVANRRYNTSIQRFSGYCAGLKESGINLNENLVSFEYTDKQELAEFMSQNKPEGIFAFNDTVATVVYSVLVDMKISVGKDVSLIGYDNSSVCNLLPVKLSSVTYNSEEIGFYAASILNRMQNEREYPRIDVKLFQPEIVERESCLPVLNEIHISI